MDAEWDSLIGKIAVEKGLITDAQLAQCVSEQQSGTAPKAAPRKSSPPLGVVMLSKGLIQEKDLIALLEEQNRRMKALQGYQRIQTAEFLFGQLLVKHSKATQNQINKCLETQQRKAEQGAHPVPRLGELLVEYGFVEKQTVSDILKLQNKNILFCTGCTKQFNVIGVEEGKSYKCKECGGTMISRAVLDSLRADDTTFGFDLPEESR